MNITNKVHHIVLIDDDHDDCELFGEALHQFDPSLKLSCLTDNERLISFLKEKNPDMIFLDVNMPKRNGFECLDEIRALSLFDNIPVIMYSNTGRQQDIDQAYSNGASLFIRKPTTFKALVDSLKEVTSTDWGNSLKLNSSSLS